MKKTCVILILFLFTMSLFDVSGLTVSKDIPTFYLSLGGCFLLSIFFLITKYKTQTLRFTASEILIIVFLLYAIVSGEYQSSLNPEWIITGVSLLVFYLVARRVNLQLMWLFVGIVLLGMGQALYGLWQYLHWFKIESNNFHIIGSFDNPAGFASALVVAYSFTLYITLKKSHCLRLLGMIAAQIIVLAVVLSQSRAGIMALVVITVCWGLKITTIKLMKLWSTKNKILLSAALLVCVLISLYFWKKDSADGRLLIWQCTTNLIAHNPIFGAGAGGFQREYMLYQAEYFRNHPDSRYVMLADIVKHPFNEFLLLLAEHGLLGGLMFGIFIYYLMREYKKNNKIECFYALLCIVGMSVFGCFSYFFIYPFTRLVMLLSVVIIMKNERVLLIIPPRISTLLKPLLLIGGIVLLAVVCKTFQNEYRWNVIARRSLAGETKTVLPEYEQLYKMMNRNGLFLYNFGAELNFIDENENSNRYFHEASRFMNDIDLQLQMADNYVKMNQYMEAEKCYLLASDMIPNRFIPLYRLAKMYEKMHKTEDARRIAKLLIAKPIKVISPDILAIRKEMETLLRSVDIKKNDTDQRK